MDIENVNEDIEKFLDNDMKRECEELLEKGIDRETIRRNVKLGIFSTISSPFISPEELAEYNREFELNQSTPTEIIEIIDEMFVTKYIDKIKRQQEEEKIINQIMETEDESMYEGLMDEEWMDSEALEEKQEREMLEYEIRLFEELETVRNPNEAENESGDKIKQQDTTDIEMLSVDELETIRSQVEAENQSKEEELKKLQEEEKRQQLIKEIKQLMERNKELDQEILTLKQDKEEEIK